MTEEQIERAARKYCELVGIDPERDMMKYQSMPTYGYSTGIFCEPVWKTVADRIRKKLDDDILTQVIIMERSCMHGYVAGLRVVSDSKNFMKASDVQSESKGDE